MNNSNVLLRDIILHNICEGWIALEVENTAKPGAHS